MNRTFSFLAIIATFTSSCWAQDKPSTEEKDQPAPATAQDVTLADGGLTMKAPQGWEKVTPKSSMIEAEFAIPKLETDPANGRVIIMASGGTIEQNIDRWYGQFTQPDGKDTKDVAKIEVKEVNKLKIHIVDISGTFLDTMGNPGGPKTARDNYRMLGAIIEWPAANYYLKCYGPAETMKKNVDGITKMIESVRTVD
jgi:hypothetical protein